jgi:histidyl-tRNA synthetase
VTTIKSPRGTQDILPGAWPLWRHVYEAAERVAEGAGYGRIEVPMFEHAALFTHATGEHTDVNREMYVFEDRGGDQLALRPEGTASAFRAYFEHGMRVLPQPVRLYYLGSMFRYERPQKGRFREHHQFGCEAIGSGDALVDASLVGLQGRFYRACGLNEFRVVVNSIGDSTCRPAYLRELVSYLKEHESELCGQCRERIDRNPLRVLDCKVVSCQPILDRAPRTLDGLCDDCRAHWARFLDGMNALEIPYDVQPRLVRGLDYYTRTVWEYQPDEPGGAQSTIGGGGRYDALAEAIGAPAAPGVGFSTGLERVILNLAPDAVASMQSGSIEVFIAPVGPAAGVIGLGIAGRLWNAGIRADMGFDSRALGTQLKQADARGAALAVVIGETEMVRGVAGVKVLATGEQSEVRVEELTDTIARMLAATGG